MLKAFLGVILAVVFLGFLLMMGVGFLATSTKRDAMSGTNDVGYARNIDSQPAISVTAPKLYFDYQANEVQADNIYKGRHLVVRGMVSQIRKDFMDNIIVALASTNEFESVDAQISKSYAATAAGLQKWQIVDVDCEGEGMVVGSPQLKDCSIQLAHNNPPQPSPPIVTQEPQESKQQGNSNAVTSQPSEDDGSQQPAPIVRQTPADTSSQN